MPPFRRPQHPATLGDRAAVAVVAALALATPGPAAASAWKDAADKLTKAAGFTADDTAQWNDAAAALLALSATCASFTSADEFDRAECAAKLAGLQEEARQALLVERTYAARIMVTLREFDFAASRFPLAVAPTVKVVVYEPGQCDTALVWGGPLGGAPLCLFVAQPKVTYVDGTLWYMGTRPTAARYPVLKATVPPLTTETIPADVARRVRDAVRSEPLPADITFRWQYEADKCTPGFEVKGQGVHGYCWAPAPAVDLHVVWPRDLAAAIASAVGG